MDKKYMLQCLIDYYTGGNKAKFAKMLGVSPQAISSWLARNTFDVDLIYAHCEGVSSDWLLTGKGEMIETQHPAESLGDRLRLFIAHKQISTRQFEASCGLGNGYARTVKDNITTDSMEKIKDSYPELNQEWLLHGSGTMLQQEQSVKLMQAPSANATPVYDLDATCGDVNRPMDFAVEQIIGYVALPNVSTSTSIIRANGDSMAPKINDGDWIAVRELTDFETIDYGRVHLIITEQNRFVKFVRRYADDEPNYVILRSENQNYDDILLPKHKIVRMFIVENILSLKMQ